MKILTLILSSILNLICWIVYKNGSPDTIINYAPLISIISSVIACIKFNETFRIEFRTIYILISGILIFNTPWYFTYVFDEPSGIEILSHYSISLTSFVKSNLLLGISLPLILLGYNACNNKFPVFLLAKGKIKRAPFNSLIIITFILLLLSISVTGFTIGSLFIGASSYWYILLVRFIALTSCAYYFNKIQSNRNYNKKFFKLQNKIFFILIFLFILYLTIGGDRGPIIVVIIILCTGYLISNKRQISYKIIFILPILILFVWNVLSIIANVRISNFGSEFDFTNISQYNNAEEEFSSGFSQICTCLAIEGVESNRFPHSYGLFIVQSIIQSIPFLGNKILDLINIPNLYREGSAMLLTVYYYGKNPTTGLGSTYLADTYIEFGMFGIIFISFIFGYLVKIFDNLLRIPDRINFPVFCLLFFFAGYSLYIGRANLYTFLISFIHAYIFYLLIFKVLKFKKND